MKSQNASIPTLSKMMHSVTRHPLNLIITCILSTLVLCSLFIAAVHMRGPDRQEVLILGQQEQTVGFAPGFRVLVRNRITGAPIEHAHVSIDLKDKDDNPIPWGQFETDASGTISKEITVPNLPDGSYALHIEVRSDLGEDEVQQQIRIVSDAKLKLTTDKPLYQLGQKIHMRAMAVKDRNGKPLSGRELTFEVIDAKGNKVFREKHKASEFGIASADFQLATMVNAGRYTLRVQMGDVTTERNVEVKPYLLPDFRVKLTLDRPWYLHQETVHGEISASYSFGKPIQEGWVTWQARTSEGNTMLIGEGEGAIGEDGRFVFELPLKGTSQSGFSSAKDVPIQLTAILRDGAGQEESTMVESVVSSEALHITAVPEAGTWIKGVENIVYVRINRPDGTPVVCSYQVNGHNYETDALGMGAFRVPPSNKAQESIAISAVDSKGFGAVTKLSLGEQSESMPFLLRPEKFIYAVGEKPRFMMFKKEAGTSSKKVFVDVIREGVIVAREHFNIQGDRTAFELSLDESITGRLSVYAYVLTDTGLDQGCRRFIEILPSSGLNISTNLSQSQYLPGETATVEFSVTDLAGNPAPSALGISIIDDRVLALAEKESLLFHESSGEVSNQKTHRSIAFELAMAHQPVSGMGIEDLVKGGVLDQRTANRIKLAKGTDAYEELRKHPEFASVFKLLESGGETYNFRENTGLFKAFQHEEDRRKMFASLLSGSTMVFLTFGTILFIAFWIFDSWAEPIIPPNVEPSNLLRSAYTVQAHRAIQWMSVFTFVPWAVYLSIVFWTNQRSVPGSLVGLLSFLEMIFVVGFYVSRNLKTNRNEHSELGAEIKKLGEYRAWFVAHFLLIRSYLIMVALLPSANRESHWVFGAMALFLIPLFILMMFQSHVDRQSELLGAGIRRRNDSVAKVLAVLAIMIILAGMLLPALSKAKAKAQKIGMVSMLKNVDLAMRIAETERKTTASSDSKPPRIRKHFPETLYWNPELITDDQGKVKLEIPLADSITTWKASIAAIDMQGRMGSAAMDLLVFQDFFVDLDVPESLTLGDEYSLPVACYNYLDEEQELRLELVTSEAFGTTVTQQKLVMKPGEVTAVHFPIEMKRVGYHPVRIMAYGHKASDAVERVIQVKPSGTKVEHALNDVLKESLNTTFHLPEGIVPESESLWVKLYPSRFSEVVEGLDGILKAPYGCFEQTSSVTYPNVLVLDYLQRVGRLTPEIEKKAREFIQTGYQRLLTFEVPGGGFDWYGRAPANVCLTAYGILEFTDMARVHTVDQAVIERARKWLFAQQAEDGSWSERRRGWTWDGRGTMTCFVAWALAQSGDRSAELQRALHYLRSHPEECYGAYNMALAASAFLMWDQQDAFGLKLAEDLSTMAVDAGEDALCWKQKGSSVTYSRGNGFDVECSSLSVVALMRAGKWPEIVRQGLNWISQQKQANGTYGSTQANILALRALLAGSNASLGQVEPSTIYVQINGRIIETFSIQKENSDLFRQLELTPWLQKGDNLVKLQQIPEGAMPVTLLGNYWMPKHGNTETSQLQKNNASLKIETQFSNLNPKPGEIVDYKVSVRNTSLDVVNMPLIDLGVPPGMVVNTSVFESLQSKGRIDRYERSGGRVRLYLRQLQSEEEFQFTIGLVPENPMRIQVPSSKVYEYYQPSNRAESDPIVLTVGKL